MECLLTDDELEWVRLQPFLLQHGYKLRPRYHPSWKPSWKRPWNFYKYEAECEDSIPLRTYNVIDAVRIKDGHLNSDEMRADPRNNAVPLLEVIPVPLSVPLSDEDSDPDHVMLLVMPRLAPQVFRGIEFLHDNGIAHRQVSDCCHSLYVILMEMFRDACMFNFMMDPTDVIPGGFHHSIQFYQPDGKTLIRVRDRCTVPSLKYYIIDFETAEYFPPNSLCTGLIGQEKAAPELSRTVPFDPYKLDIYQLGMLVHRLMEKIA
ncbi:hypothetical protein JR316_0008914 [Psilocybe cubensis]|uniref:Uncharacterized protein n=1 Tax=Psilocybe cubensis TaxID=181762 RepID=A0ACB8GTW5_PSICU|nr:hypothetical protein JR316_0008914 [Psilocybe cubensis]KAH9478459.1 hypothetical protein JR316_0008914 [Psilocybe cubensis]